MKSDPRSPSARLQTARGHLDSVIRMVDEDRYCIDVLHQISAVQGALDRIRREIFESHVRSCVPERVLAGNVDEVAKELVGAAFGAAPKAENRYRVAHCQAHGGGG
jgi:DNA-binding FrmR family transcriptional regulator